MARKPHFILMVGDDGVILAEDGVPRMRPSFFAAPGAAGIAAVMARLAQYPGARVDVLADTLAQDFRRESLPRVGFLDRRNLIARRLAQAFPQAGLAAHIKIGGKEILLAGAHENGPVFEWLERLAATAPRLCLLPVECAPLAARLLPDAGDGWAMLLSRQRTGGFRQIVTFKGELAFARLTPPLPPSAGVSEVVEAVARDIKASLGYLARLGLKDARQLDVMLLMPNETHAALGVLRPMLRSLDLLSPHDAAVRFHLPFVPHENDPYADLVYAGWVARRRARLPLMLPAAKQIGHARRARAAAGRAALAASVLAGLFGGWQGYGFSQDVSQQRLTQTRLLELRQAIRAENAQVSTGAPVGILRAASERKKIFAQAVPAPWPVLAMLGQGLGADARLVKLDWQAGMEDTGNGGKKAETLAAEIRLTGALPDADREKTLARFRMIADNIARKAPGYNMAVLHYPFPALPGEALSGGGEGTAPPLTTAGIELKKDGP